MSNTRKFAVPLVLAVALTGLVLWLVLGKNDPPDTTGYGPVNQEGWEWADYRNVALPSSEADGPAETDNGLAHGFSQTRTGALLAGAHIMARIRAEAGPAVYEPTVTDQTVGPGRDSLLRNVRYQYGQTGEQSLRPDTELLGYRFLTFTPEKASYELLLSPKDQDTRYSAALEVQWNGSDWLLLVPEGGGWKPSIPDALTQEDFELFAGGSE